MTRILERRLHHGMILEKLCHFLFFLVRHGELTAGLKLNSTTVPGSSLVTLFGVKVKFPPRPTSMCKVRVPPTGNPPGGEVLVEAVAALALYASSVFPEVGLR